MTPLQYLVYHSSKIDDPRSVPCKHKIASHAQLSEPTFPMVETKCSNCEETHAFRLDKTYIVDTPGMEKHFALWCKANGVEMLS